MAKLTLPAILDKLQAHYGEQKPDWPTLPEQFLIWWHCGYPPSEKACQRGWDSLKSTIGTDIPRLIEARKPKLVAALKAGGMIPELRADRIKEVATKIHHAYSGDLTGALRAHAEGARKILRQFPGIADPGADRILLFGDITPVAAVPSNCPHVLPRILTGRDDQTYRDKYKTAQQAIDEKLPEDYVVRRRAYLLLKVHGQDTCKAKPQCGVCPVHLNCAYYKGSFLIQSATS